MKKIIFGILFLFSIGASAQTKNCVTPIPNYTFQQKFTSVKAQNGDDQRLPAALKLAKENCLSTSQVKEVAELFENDYNRLAFVQEAYLSTTDKDNFYEVYNSFLYFSTVFRLHDYIASTKTVQTNASDNVVSKEMTFPDYQYPDYKKYYGKTGCREFANDQEFLDFANSLFKEKSDNSKVYIAKSYVQRKCILTAQAMKIASLLTSETDRLDFMKSAYSKVYDPDNYKYAHQVFKTDSYKKELASFTGTTSAVISNDPPCEVSAADFQAAKTQISKESFNNTKINLAKQIIKSKKCFKTQQIIELLTLFTISTSKMDIAKFAFDYTSDKENYYKVADSFSFSADKDNFLQFLKTKEGR